MAEVTVKKFTQVPPELLQTSDSDHLVDELYLRGVFFLSGGSQNSTSGITASMLLAALATSNEARLRLSIIPLLLRHPEYAPEVKAALGALPIPAQLTLKCYYTAAVFLQQKYAPTLKSLFNTQEALPDLFSAEFELLAVGNSDERLYMLAERHQLLSDRYINWLGTYEHAAQRFISSMQQRRQWQI